jgi:hypothetical protein
MRQRGLVEQGQVALGAGQFFGQLAGLREKGLHAGDDALLFGEGGEG